MKTRTPFPLVAVLFAVFILSIQSSSHADTFGSANNQFTIDFVSIGNTNNTADTTGYGAVPYAYRISKYEISHETILKPGLANITAGPWTGKRPAATISWYEAAAFVNWLNTNSGYQAAYNLAFTNGGWSMQLWSSAEAWTAGGTNFFRHKDARYFLPSENEWYKAAYYNPLGTNYFLYPTGNDTPPASGGGTNTNTAVYGLQASTTQQFLSAMSFVDQAGGLSPYGTMGQGGNLWEWTETAFDGLNDDSSDERTFRGGYAFADVTGLRSSSRFNLGPSTEDVVGFRVASVALTTNVVLTVEKTSSLTDQWQVDRVINVGPMTNTKEFYRLKIDTILQLQ